VSRACASHRCRQCDSNLAESQIWCRWCAQREFGRRDWEDLATQAKNHAEAAEAKALELSLALKDAEAEVERLKVDLGETRAMFHAGKPCEAEAKLALLGEVVEAAEAHVAFLVRVGRDSGLTASRLSAALVMKSGGEA